MASRSSRLRRLEHRFFELFFIRIAGEDGSIDLDELDARFLNAWHRLAEPEVERDELVDLLQRLRPDPVTGVSGALRRSIQRLQPGRVSIPNPGYRDGDILPGAREGVGELARDLGEEFPERFKAAVAAFKA